MTKKEFSQLYKNNESAFLNFARRLSNCPASAQDLVQEAALKAFRSLHTFKIGSNYKSWMFTIIKNTFISQYRKVRRRATIHTPVEEIMYAIDRKKTARNEGESNLRMQSIEKCIEGLSLKSKEPFRMFITGYQYNEISTQMQIPIGTVKSRINYARTKLKSQIQKFDHQVAA